MFWRSFSVDRQLQSQVVETLELVAVDHDQGRADGGEGRVGLRLEELDLGQLDVPGRDVVGDDQGGDVVGPVVGGDRGSDRHLATDHEADLDLIVEQPDVGGPDDVVVGAGIDPDALRKNVNGVCSGFMPTSLTREAKFVAWATTLHGAVTGETSAKLSTGTVSVLFPAAAMGRLVGQQFGRGLGLGGDPCHPGGCFHPPGVSGAKDGSAHDWAPFSRPRTRWMSNSLSPGRALTTAASSPRVPGPSLEPRKSLVAGGPHWRSPETVNWFHPVARVLSNMSPSVKCSTRNPSGSRQ